MGNAALAEELASTDELEELYQLDASESEPEDDDEDGADGDKDGDENEDGGGEIHPEGMPVE